VVGFRESPNPQFGKIDPDLTKSESGIFFQTVHPLVNLDNLFSICQNVKEFVFPAYNRDFMYHKGDRVSDSGITYESLIADNHFALTEVTAWKVITYQNMFSDYLRVLRDDAIHKIFARVVEAKKLRTEIKDVFENIDLYQGIGRADDVIVKSGRFVFYEFYVKAPSHLSVMISSVTTQFNTAQGPLDIYVYRDGNYEPKIIPVELSKAMSIEKTTISITLQAGFNYVGYYEDDLVGQALRKKDYYWNSPPCSSCNTYNTMSYSKWSQYTVIRPGYVLAENLPGDFTLWDLHKNVYEANNNWGLNFGITVGCDITDFIITNRDMFAHPLSIQLGLDVLYEIAFSVRNNYISTETKKYAMYALDNTNNSAIGRIDNNSLMAQLERAIKAMDFDLSGFSECMPCYQVKGIKYSAI